jgi:hypothetical protein
VPLFRRETILQFPGRRRAANEPALALEEFVAEENVNYRNDMSTSERVSADNKTVKTSNLSSPPQDEEPSEVI